MQSYPHRDSSVNDLTFCPTYSGELEDPLPKVPSLFPPARNTQPWFRAPESLDLFNTHLCSLTYIS